MVWWLILIILYLISHAIGVVQLQYTAEEFDFVFLSPYTLYKYCKVNVFGAIFLWLLHLAFTPIYALIGLFIWLCTARVK